MAKRRAKRKLPQLLTAAEVRDFGGRILALWANEERDRGNMRSNHIKNGLKALTSAWALAAALRGDIAQLDPILELLDDEELLDDDESPADTLFRAATVLVGDEPELRARLYDLADSSSPSVQFLLARWLDARIEAEKEVLDQLATDGADWVSKAARKQLAEVVEVDWWQGHFDADPLAGLEGEAAQAALPPLQEFARLHNLASNEQKPEHNAEMVALVARMEPSVARMAAARLLGKHTLRGEPLDSLVRLTIALPEGAETLLDAGETYDSAYSFGALLEGVATQVPDELRRALVQRAFERLRACSLTDLIEQEGPVNCLTLAIGKWWPKGDDPKPILDFLLEVGDQVDEGTFLRFQLPLSDCVTPATAEFPWARPLFEEALAAGREGKYKAAYYALNNLARGLPAEVALELARRVVADEAAQKGALGWALAVVPVDERAVRFQDPVVRNVLFPRQLEGRLLVLARAELRAGKLTPREAGQVLFQLNVLWPSCIDYINRWLPDEDEDDDAKDDLLPPLLEHFVARRDQFVAEQDPAFFGPVTDAEWSEIRRLRDLRTPAELIEDWDIAIHFPPGRWHPDDRRQFDAICEHLLDIGVDEEDHSLARFLMSIAAVKGDPSHIEMVDQLGQFETDPLGEANAAVRKLQRKNGLPQRKPKVPVVDEDAPEADESSTDDDW